MKQALNPRWLVLAAITFAACMLLGAGPWLSVLIALCWGWVVGGILISFAGVIDLLMRTRLGDRIDDWLWVHEHRVKARRAERRRQRGRARFARRKSSSNSKREGR